MQSVLLDQRTWIRRSPWSSLGGCGGGEEAEGAEAKGVTGVCGRQGWIRDSLHTALGVKAWAARSANSSRNSL